MKKKIPTKLPHKTSKEPTFQDWWDKSGFDVQHFKPCRAAWNAAKKTN